MKRFILSFVVCLLISLGISAQQVLKFQKDKPFRILQLTDLHYIYGDERSVATIDNIHAMIDFEKPDLVIVTGDLIFGKPAYESMKAVLDAIASHGVPFAVTYGNHDDENGMSRAELLALAKTYDMNLSTSTEGITGVTNYVLQVMASDADKPSQLLFIFDSNTYSKVAGVKGYDVVHFDQINWYRTQSQMFAEANEGRPLPALAFMHIPVPEYGMALSENSFFIGTRVEKGGFPKLNSGLFAAARELGDIRAFFSGHDHNNDYVTYYHDIALAYGRYSGCNTVYNDVKPNGGRIIELREGETAFRTYVRLHDGSIINDIVVPNFFKCSL